MWQPPRHQNLISPDHPSGHRCDECSSRPKPLVVGRRLTLRGARKRAEHLALWSLAPGYFYAHNDGDPAEQERLPIGS